MYFRQKYPAQSAEVIFRWFLRSATGQSAGVNMPEKERKTGL